MLPDINSWNERVIAEFRSNAGHVRWSTEEDLATGRPVPPLLPGFDEHRGVPIILVRNTGAKTRRERINPLMYQPVGGDFAVFATYGGSPRPPAWFHNLVAHPRAVVETGEQEVPVTARLTEGVERERIWTRQVTLVPTFAEFEATAGREIPILLLERPREGAGTPEHGTLTP
ncbi:nitroreductase/quinone reductase family protein [Streptomyces oceani]|uniref:Nitroreductase n=1 Tax=Streptomyces oceani TaxID=1075402 RepID=A0A1E7KJQ4_9ACTN|nr:nitroreductase/quinone reductase family protein [Streptomyces oceani]OEV04140.1 hypothetical protein AN216_07955 [Streptomyces oceani]